ncbi:hypothetical protein RHECNPAF_470018 [Rhizobium etli CNPAF512]|nr:hypothetical protein RHECNPAF_470018 [Rhizobium etli CNPAF512]
MKWCALNAGASFACTGAIRDRSSRWSADLKPDLAGPASCRQKPCRNAISDIFRIQAPCAYQERRNTRANSMVQIWQCGWIFRHCAPKGAVSDLR